jgi:hypothetical protein
LLAAAFAVVACGGSEFSAENEAIPSPTAASTSVTASTSAGGAGGVGTVDTTGGSSGSSSMAGMSGSLDAATASDAAADVVREAPVRDVVANDGNVVTKCPPTELNPASACADGLECTYGAHPRLACRKQYSCIGSQWVLAPGMTCSVPPDCNAEQVKPQVGASCATLEHECAWSSGLYCRCLSSSMGATWDCYPSPSGCGVTPPNKGQTCDLSTKTCDYGTCPLGTKVTTSCSGGLVRWAVPSCP